MALEDDQYRLLTVGAETETVSASEIPSIMMASRLTDELVLECIAATASREKCSLPEAIQILVAENILRLGILDGRKQVYGWVTERLILPQVLLEIGCWEE